MPFVTTKDGTKLFYNDWGAGKPVVLIHGWPLNSDMWEYQARVLVAAGHRVIAYDRRGFGRSDQPWDGYDYDTLADDLGALLDELGLEGAALIGFSMGAGEVARYIARHGTARVSKAVLMGGVVPGLLDVPRSVFDGMIDTLQDDRPGFLEGFGKVFFGVSLLTFSVSSALLAWSQGMALMGSARATIECVKAFSGTDFTADCAKMTVPTLIQHGDADATVPFDVSAKRAAAMIAGSELIVYKGAPHALFYTERKKVNEDLVRFLAA